MIGHLRGAAMVALAAALLGGCSVGVSRTPGMNLYAQGRIAEAIPLLQADVAAGNVPARYSLGLAYRDGQGVERDPVRAEVLLTGAAIGGDPRAVAAVREMLRTQNRCEKDGDLHDLWGGMVAYRNLITGVVELFNAHPPTLRRMAEIYEAPCNGRPVQEEAAKALRGLAGGPRHIWIYVPG
jgi:TPR repeat protein